MTEQDAKLIKARHRASLMRVPGVHGVGLQQNESGDYQLLVLADPSADLTQLPARIEDLVVTAEVSGPFTAYSTGFADLP